MPPLKGDNGMSPTLGVGKYGVWGESDDGTGVVETCSGGIGVEGASEHGNGVMGVSQNVHGVLAASRPALSTDLSPRRPLSRAPIARPA